MKSPHEIAWNLMRKDNFFQPREISEITGICIENVICLTQKKNIRDFITYIIDGKISLLKQVIEEIEQGKPHWEIGDV